MDQMANKEAELYIHIPFCVRKCAYCDFLSFAAEEEERRRYVDSLLHEAAAASGELKHHGIRSVFIGGGTPTVLSADQLRRILEMLFRCYSVRKDAEITIECNPGTADKEKLTALRDAGFNRLSIGAQSFEDDLLRSIGRIHNSSQIVSCFETARAAGFENINLDLISGLPGQTIKAWRDTLKKAAELSPEHISAYSLILEEGTPLFDRKNALTFPDEEEERGMYYDTAEILAGYGFEQYEISNYARPGKECIHNIGYWTGVEYKGLGLGASSFVDGIRYRNTEDPAEYAENCDKPENQYKEVQKLSPEDQMSEFVILGMRMTKGISKAEFEEKFRKKITDIFPGVIEKYASQGFIEETEDRIRFTKEGVSVSNVILSEFV